MIVSTRKFALVTAMAFTGASLLATSPVVAQLDELIVTATKREQSLQSVPIAVSAFDATQLRNSGVDTIHELMSLAPSFQSSTNLSETQGNTIRIRGIGTQGNNPGFESAVGVFIDNVYRARAGIALTELLDIERIEVLRGPQSTLFGRNTSAGALNIITLGPEFEFGGYLEGTYGNYDMYDIRGSVTGPIAGDKLAARFSALYTERDEGFVTDLITGDELDTRQRLTLKGQLLFAPSDNVEFRLIADYRDTEDKCCYPVTLANDPGIFSSIINGFALGTQVDPADPFAREATITPGRDLAQEVEDWSISGELTWDLGSATLTSITAYRDFESFRAADIDFTNADLLFNDRFDGNELFTQELRLQGEWGKLDWLVGAYYLNEKITLDGGSVIVGSDFETAIDARLGPLFAALSSGLATTTRDFASLFTGMGVGVIPAGVLWPEGSGATDDAFKQDGESYSGFTHNVINLTDALRLTVGARFTVDEKDAESSLVGSTPGCSLLRTAIAFHPLIGDGAPGANLIMDDIGFAGDTRRVRDLVAVFGCLGITNEAFEFDVNKDDDEWSGTIKLDWDLNPETLVYASYSRGYKAGGINLDRAGTILTEVGNVTPSPTGSGQRFDVFNFLDPRFDSEIVDAYEVGLKSSLWDNKVNVNIALFYEDFSNFQLNTFTGFNFQAENVEAVTSKGVEFELQAAPVEGLDLRLGAVYTDARYGSSITDLSNTLVNDNFNEPGNPLELTPRAFFCLPMPVGFAGLLPAPFPPGGCDPLAEELSPLAGKTLTNAPKWVVTGGITYSTPIGNTGYAAFAHLDGRYSSSYNTGSDLDAVKEQEGFVVFNGRIGVSALDGGIEVEFWGRNLFDEDYQSIAFDIPLQANDGFGSFLAPPRTYGVTVRGNF